MAETQTWRIDTGDRVREVVVTSVHRGLWRCEDGPRETSPAAAVRAYAHFDGCGGMAVAPGEMTRGELAAQLATATASVQQLRADVELATAQRDAEACRADNTETERDEARAALAAVTAERDVALEECSTLRRGLDHADGVIDHTRASLGAADDEGAVVAAERVTRELAVLRAQQAPLVACVDALRAAATSAGWRDADASGETLVAWVRRGVREACAVRCDAIYTERDDAARKRRKYGTQNTCDGDCARLAGQAQGAAMCVEAIREGGE